MVSARHTPITDKSIIENVRSFIFPPHIKAAAINISAIKPITIAA